MTAFLSPLAAVLADAEVARLVSSLHAAPGAPYRGDEPVRWAAVALVLRCAASGVELLLIRRSHHAGDPWSGHVALPGGRCEAEDPDLAATAVRETREETAVDILRDGRILGALDDVRPRASTFPPIIVRPFVAAVSADVAPEPSPEVAAAFWVPLEALRERGRWIESMVPAGGTRVRVPSFVHGDHVIWGLTERILSQLLGRLA